MKKNYLIRKNGEILIRVHSVILDPDYKKQQEDDGCEFIEFDDSMIDDSDDLEFDAQDNIVVNQQKKDKRKKRKAVPKLEKIVKALLLNDTEKLDQYRAKLLAAEEE